MNLSRSRLQMATGPKGGRGYSKTFSLSGVGSDMTNYILPVRVHRGLKLGDASQPGDIYLDNRCKTDFSDVSFTDADGNLLSIYLAGYGNYELIPDSRLGKDNWIYSDGAILADCTTDTPNGLQRSFDNGATWTTELNIGGVIELVFVDSRGYAYAVSTNQYKLYRSTNWTTGSPTWTQVLDLTGISGRFQPYACSEDTNGCLYFGRYQTANNPSVWKSTDGGSTWVEIFGYTICPARPRNKLVALGVIVRPSTPNSHLYVCTVSGTTADAADDGTHPMWPTTTNATVIDGGATWREAGLQHIHGLNVDPLTNYIYAGVDGAYPKIIRSIDGGVSWTVIRDAPDCDVTQMVFLPGERFFGGGAASETVGSAILKTTDDSTFTVSLLGGYTVQILYQLGNTLYAATSTYKKSSYVKIFRSTDNGATWITAWVGPYDNSGATFKGYVRALNTGIPTGDNQTQVIFGSESDAIKYVPLRVYEGNNHYQATYYVTIKSLPASGTFIKVHCSDSGNSNITIFPNRVLAPAPLCRWKLDEGSGTTILDTGSANKPGVLTIGTGAWGATNGRFAGPFVPSVVQAGKSYNFHNDNITITNSANDAAFNLVNNYTIPAWLKLDPAWATTGNYLTIIGKGYPSSATGYFALAISSGGSLAFYLKGAGGLSTVTKFNALVDPIQPKESCWHQVGVALDSMGNVQLIFDGYKGEPQIPVNGNFSNDAAAPLIIGSGVAGARWLYGSLDDIQIYNYDVAASDIRSLYEDRPIGTSESQIS